ncbi:hypothetical protein C1645_830123 [Glomus cerebriforme]|uniref:HCP-like protein n=1 Tax=Glomus cerebriforme TaxID=658196 RepID=A0A397SPD0_9GLOM|nr:hypothetical protein C1645_830123 [Glomus cerebriforme]
MSFTVYKNGKGTEIDLEKAIYSKAVENGEVVALSENGYSDKKFYLGYCYINGIGTEIDKIKGFELYNETANCNVQDNLNNDSEKTANDLDKFIIVNLGFICAQYKLGCIYDHGIEIDIDNEKAFELYKIAAKRGNFDAQKCLASLYEKGECVQKEADSAINWYKKVVENGSRINVAGETETYLWAKLVSPQL